MSFYTLSPDPAIGSPESFNLRECRRNCGCEVDPVRVLAAGYPLTVGPMWEKCLSTKWSVGDCITGCHNSSYDSALVSLTRNSHQYCISRKSIIDQADKIKSTPLPEAGINTFEDLYRWLNDTVGIESGIGQLTTYDIALRLGWNYAAGRIEPRDFVYLHAGARDGALALQQLSVVRKFKYIKTDIDLASAVCVPIDTFCADLRALGANHLENFLCVFHSLFECWLRGL